jgi:hypothetical protein
VSFRKRESALLALGTLLMIIGSVLLAWNILADPYVLTVFDGQWASITREGMSSNLCMMQTQDGSRKPGIWVEVVDFLQIQEVPSGLVGKTEPIYCMAKLCLLTRTLLYYCLPMAQVKPLLALGP